MAVRGWLGYSRRWWGGPQSPAYPAEVIVVGHDQSDGASLSAQSATSAGGGGNSGTLKLGPRAAVRGGVDCYVTRIATDSNQGLLLRVLDQELFTGAGPELRDPPSPVIVSGIEVQPPDPVTYVKEPASVLDFQLPGLLLLPGQQLVVQHPTVGANLAGVFWFMEAR